MERSLVWTYQAEERVARCLENRREVIEQQMHKMSKEMKKPSASRSLGLLVVAALAVVASRIVLNAESSASASASWKNPQDEAIDNADFVEYSEELERSLRGRRRPTNEFEPDGEEVEPTPPSPRAGDYAGLAELLANRDCFATIQGTCRRGRSRYIPTSFYTNGTNSTTFDYCCEREDLDISGIEQNCVQTECGEGIGIALMIEGDLWCCPSSSVEAEDVELPVACEETARRRLMEQLSQEDMQLLQGDNPCIRVLATLGDDLDARKMCQAYDSLPYVGLDCKVGEESVVPKIFHSISRDSTQNHHQAMVSAVNPEYVRNHVSDQGGLEFVRENCGEKYAQVYSCLAPPAFRADLFRFCALYKQGGIYLDSDIVPLVPLDEMYSPCAVATIGHDIPQGQLAGKQMKILAGAPGAPIFKCMLDRIAENVQQSAHPNHIFLVSGPSLLQKCYEQNNENVAITYHDTREAQWPFTGLRQGNTVLAYEKPSRKAFEHDDSDYAVFFREGKLYDETCALSPRFTLPSLQDRIRYHMGEWYSPRLLFDLPELCKEYRSLSWSMDESLGSLNDLGQNEAIWENKKEILLVQDGSQPIEALRHVESTLVDLMPSFDGPIETKLTYKYLLGPHGDDKDSNLASMLYSDSVVFMPEPAKTGWLMKSELVAWYHYIPVKGDFSDLADQVEWAKSHDRDARRIARQATEFMKRMWLDDDAKSGLEKVRKGVLERFEKNYGESLQKCQDVTDGKNQVMAPI